MAFGTLLEGLLDELVNRKINFSKNEVDRLKRTLQFNCNGKED